MQFDSKIIPDRELLNSFLDSILEKYEEDDSIEIYQKGLLWNVVYHLPEKVLVKVDLSDIFEGGFPKAVCEDAAFNPDFLPGGIIAVEGTTYNTWSCEEDFIVAIWDFLEYKVIVDNKAKLSPTYLRVGPSLETEYETSKLTILVDQEVEYGDIILAKSDLEELVRMVEQSPLFFLVEENKLFLELMYRGVSLVGAVRKDLVSKGEGTVTCSPEFARNLLVETGDVVRTSIVRLPLVKNVVISVPKNTNETELMLTLRKLKCLNVDSFLNVEERTQTFSKVTTVFISSIKDWDGKPLKSGSLLSPKEVSLEVVLEEL